MKGPIAIFTAFAAICLVAIPYFAIAGTGGESAAPIVVEPWDEDGKELFAVACGPCHTMQAAGADGVVGPNLDDLLAPPGPSPADPATIKPRVLSAIDNGIAGRMPAGILSGSQAEEVAAFVAQVAGK